MSEPVATRAARGIRLRITLIAVAATGGIVGVVGALVVSAQRELLLDDLAGADAGARQNVAEASTELAWLLLAALPVVVVAVAALVWSLVGRTLQPVEAIRVEVEQLSADDLHRRVPVPGTGDEVDRLAATMNEMLARLEAARDRQDRFVADASHELRTPLARMITELEVDEAHPDTADAPRTRAAPLRQARGLADLVDALLTLAPYDRLVVAAPAPVDLDDIVLAEAAGVMTPPGIHIDVSDVHAAQVRVQERALGLVVGNLLDNAVRHAATTVTLRVDEAATGVRLRVADDGPGIPVGMRDTVFERFTRLDEARSSHDGGSGLGLAIVRDVVQRCGGQVSAGDRDDGSGGAQLTVLLPPAAPQAAAAEDPQAGPRG